MFRLMRPDQIRVVIMAQDPYPTRCPVNGVPYAYGIAFYRHPRAATIPKTLQVLAQEAARVHGSAGGDHDSMLALWMAQGVFLTNSALTTAHGLPSYLCDHGVMWEYVMRSFLSYVFHVNPRIVFVFMGSKAWKLESALPVSRSISIKVPHPVSRGNEFIGCDVFAKVNEKVTGPPITWMF